jgi:hypothetical protein
LGDGHTLTPYRGFAAIAGMSRKEELPDISNPTKLAGQHVIADLPHLKKGWKGALGLFALGLLIGFGFAWGMVVSSKDATIETLTVGIRERDHKIEEMGKELVNSPKSIGKSFPQVMIYSKDPNAERVVPDATNRPALAYGGTNASGYSVYLWDTNSQNWQCILR